MNIEKILKKRKHLISLDIKLKKYKQDYEKEDVLSYLIGDMFPSTLLIIFLLCGIYGFINLVDYTKSNISNFSGFLLIILYMVGFASLTIGIIQGFVKLKNRFFKNEPKINQKVLEKFSEVTFNFKGVEIVNKFLSELNNEELLILEELLKEDTIEIKDIVTKEIKDIKIENYNKKELSELVQLLDKEEKFDLMSKLEKAKEELIVNKNTVINKI